MQEDSAPNPNIGSRSGLVGVEGPLGDQEVQAGPPMGRIFASLGFQDYRFLWTGTVVTQTGQWMQQVAQGWLVLQLTNSPFQLGLVGFFRGLPLLLFSLLGGVVADRFNRKRVLIMTQVVALGVALFLTLFTATGWVQIWHIYITSLIGGVVMAVNQPVRQALVYDLVGRGNITNAVALNSAGFNVTRILGPSLGGVIIGLVGVPLCFGLQALGFLWALYASFRIHPPAAPTASSQGSVWQNLGEGLHYIRRNETIFSLMFIATIPALFGMPYVQMLPAFARDVLNAGASGLGLLLAATGLGAVVGSLTIAGLGEFRSKGIVLLISSLFFGGLLILFAFSPWFWLSLLFLVGVGLANSISMSVTNTLLQTTTRNELRGRVMSAFMMTFGLMPLGSLPMGAMADVAGPPLAVALGGAAVALSILGIGVLAPQLRRLG